MSKTMHEFRDPVHSFVKLDSDERMLINSEPFQRLRYIHQLAMTYLIYPGSTHTRFEHSIGCMYLATRIFDTITSHENLQKLPYEVRERIPEIERSDRFQYWRKTLRLAALCHDLGHLPFSHAAEDLLPPGINHETMTKRFILEGMLDIWAKMEPQPNPKKIAKIAVGEKDAQELLPFSPWERILSEIITGDVFGADRMDYLLRDSFYAGVTYGHFEHNRLIDTMRILPGTAQDDTEQYNSEPELGIEQGGLQVAESLLVARYFMFTQVYFHNVRRIYDIHLKSFLKSTLENGVYPTDLNAFLATTDNEILSKIRAAARSSCAAGHEDASRILYRNHFRKVYQLMSQDCVNNPFALDDISTGLKDEVGNDNVIVDDINKATASKSDFPIQIDDGRIISAHGQSQVMTSLPAASTAYLFVNPAQRKKACSWIKKNVDTFLKPRSEHHA